MQLEPFVMERWQSTHEHHVELNLSDSGVHPLRIGELIDKDELDGLANERMIYTQSNGSIELRERIADLYNGAEGQHRGHERRVGSQLVSAPRSSNPVTR